MASLIKCPECGKLIAVRFPIHECKVKRESNGRRTAKKKDR